MTGSARAGLLANIVSRSDMETRVVSRARAAESKAVEVEVGGIDYEELTSEAKEQ